MDLIKGHNGLVLEFNKFLPATYAHSSQAVGSSSSATESNDDHPRDDHNPKTNDEPCKDQEVSPRKCDNGNNDSAPRFASTSRMPRKKKMWEINGLKRRNSECQKFLERVRQLGGNVDTYRDFLELMSDYQVHKDLDRLDNEVLKLFSDQPELYIEFTFFLADAIEAREKELENSGIEVGKDSVAGKDEGVRRSAVMEKNRRVENLYSCEEATADSMVMVDLQNKDTDVCCGEDIADLNKSPVKASSGMRNPKPPVKMPSSTAEKAQACHKILHNYYLEERVVASEEDTRDYQPPVKKQKGQKTATEYMNESPLQKIKALDDIAPDYELTFKKRKNSIPEIAVAGAATEFSLTSTDRPVKNFINTELKLSLPGMDTDAPDYEYSVKKRKRSSPELAEAGAATDFSFGENDSADENLITTKLELALLGSRINPVKK